jgi:NAD(P)-dependent dehydrogenase (short-subunit alcohol dehydrogenase family)
MIRPLDGKVVLIAGIGPGLGRQLALATARAGAQVVFASRSAGALVELAEELAAEGASAAYQTCDITSLDDCQSLVSLAVERFGRLDCLVANAFHKGAMTVTIEDANLDDWREVFEVNVLGSLRMAQAALPALRASAPSSIVLVNSQIIRRVKVGRGDYAATKAALLTAGQILAKELGPDAIRVNSVVPGRMWGPPLQDYVERTAAAGGPSAEAQHAQMLRDMTLPYIATDENVAQVIVFLASDASIGMTGQSIDVNAGETFH